MFFRAEGDKVRVRWPIWSTDQYIKPLTLLAEAEDAMRNAAVDLSWVALRPQREALLAAEADVEEMFTEDWSVDEAEKAYRLLGQAILRARVQRGDFAYDDD